MTQKERVLYLLPEKKKEQIIDAAQLGFFLLVTGVDFLKRAGVKLLHGMDLYGKVRCVISLRVLYRKR